MNEQQSSSLGERSSVHKAESMRYGFEPVPATAEVDGATGGNEPAARTAVEVMNFYTEKEMEDNADEVEKPETASEASDKIKEALFHKDS